MSRFSSLDISLANILTDPKSQWGEISRPKNKVRVARDLNVDWKRFNQDDYLFSHCTIVSSVSTEENGYYIDPVCSPLVNNNGNAWSNEVLLATFRTFCGAENYLEHIQVPELSKGKIIDAVLRPVRYKNASVGESDVFFCDILVATEKKHDELVNKIASGQLTTMSMGCLAHYVQCSKCGVILTDRDPNCTHLSSEVMTDFVDENGVKRIVAELCGRVINKNGKRVGDSESVRFIEASWVEKPAFTGAVLNHYISEVPKCANLLNLSTKALETKLEDLFSMRVADRNGMIALNIVRTELLKRRNEEMVERISKSYL